MEEKRVFKWATSTCSPETRKIPSVVMPVGNIEYNIVSHDCSKYNYSYAMRKRTMFSNMRNAFQNDVRYLAVFQFNEL